MLSWELCFCQVNKFSLSSFSFHDSILPIFFFPICKFPIELFFYFIFSTRKLNVDVPPTIFIFYLHLTFLQWNPSITITSVSPIIDYSEIYVKKREIYVYNPDFLNFSNINFGSDDFFIVGCSATYCRIFTSIPSLYARGVSNIPMHYMPIGFPSQ